MQSKFSFKRNLCILAIVISMIFPNVTFVQGETVGSLEDMYEQYKSLITYGKNNVSEFIDEKDRDYYYEAIKESLANDIEYALYDNASEFIDEKDRDYYEEIKESLANDIEHMLYDNATVFIDEKDRDYYEELLANGIRLTYALYDIDKDNVAELFMFFPIEIFGSLHIYTYKNGKVTKCGIVNDCNKLCADEYGNGVAIGGGTGAGDNYDFYILEGTKLLKTGQTYVFDFFGETGHYMYALNGKIISEETRKKYFYDLNIVDYNRDKFDYLDRYFHKK